MRNGGFTLPDMLAALVVLGLACTGLIQATRVAAKGGAAAEGLRQQSAGLQRAETLLRTALHSCGPFRGPSHGAEGGFSGGPRALRAVCDDGLRTVVLDGGGADGRLELRRTGSPARAATLRRATLELRFLGRGGSELLTRWPPDVGADRLAAVALVDAREGGVLVFVRTERDQEPRCRFDPAARDCSPPGKRP